MATHLPKLLTGNELLEALRIDVQPQCRGVTLYRLRHQGLPATKVGRVFLYPVDGVAKFLAERTTQGEAS